MSDIFMSYASEDRERIQPLLQALNQTGWSVFWDRTIPTGKTWWEVIGREIEICHSMIVVWSKISVQSKWVMEEAEAGRGRGVLFPVCIDVVTPPFGFRSIQAAHLIGWDGSSTDGSFRRFVGDIAAVLGPPPREEEEKRKADEEVKLRRQEEEQRKIEEERRETQIRRKQQEENERLRREEEAEAGRRAHEEQKKLDEEQRSKREEQRRNEENRHQAELERMRREEQQKRTEGREKWANPEDRKKEEEQTIARRREEERRRKLINALLACGAIIAGIYVIWILNRARPEPPHISFSVSPTFIRPEQTARLNWKSDNATELLIEPGVGRVERAGSLEVNPFRTTTYKIMATGPGGRIESSVTVVVTGPAGSHEQPRVPDVRGRLLQDAEAVLTGAEFQCQVVGEEHSPHPRGTVIRQEPGPEVPLISKGPVKLWISLGPGPPPSPVKPLRSTFQKPPVHVAPAYLVLGLAHGPTTPRVSGSL